MAGLGSSRETHAGVGFERAVADRGALNNNYLGFSQWVHSVLGGKEVPRK